MPTPEEENMPQCWGMSKRDVERTGSRNTDHIDFILKSVSGISNLNFMYQYCGHENGKDDKCRVASSSDKKHDKEYACRTLEVIIVGSVTDLPAKDIKRLEWMGRVLDIPVVIVYHEDYDYDYNQLVDYEVKRPNGIWETFGNKRWRSDFLSLLFSFHKKHVNVKHECKLPSYYLENWLDRKKDFEIETRLPKLREGEDDLTVSSLLRVIPGVRHLDMDAALFCDECDGLFMMIEASSDSFSRDEALKHKKKGIRMTLEISNILGAQAMRLLHEVRAKMHTEVLPSSPADVAIWDIGKTFAEDARDINSGNATMLTSVGVVEASLARHKEDKH